MDQPRQMANPTFIIGGPGSGKTREIVSRLAARYEADAFSETIVLIPTIRHGDQLRRRLVSRCGVAMRLRVETISHFSWALAPAANPPSFMLVEELLARTVRREVERGPAAYFGPIARTEGFGELVSAAVGELLAEAIDPQALSEADAQAGAAGLGALSAIFAAYVSELERRRWLHPAQTALAAADAVRAGAALPGVVMVDGFHLFRGTEVALLEALAERAEVVVTIDPDSGARARHDYERLLERFPSAEVVALEERAAADPPTVTAGSSLDHEGQLRAIARQIKQRLVDNPGLRPSDCAVAFRQVSPYISLARQVFAEYDLPLDPAVGERLRNRPLGVWLLRLLRLAQDGWRLRDLIAVLSSGFVGLQRWGLSWDDVARFARKGRENHFWAGPDRMQDIVEALRAEADGAGREALRRTAGGMTEAIKELGALLDQPPATAADHARRLDEALFGASSLVPPSSRELPGVNAEIDALRGYLRDFAAAQEMLGGEPEPFAVFAARLKREIDAPAVMLREAGGVLLAPMHTLHNLRFEFVALGGLIEGEFPARRTVTALLDNARETLSEVGLALPPAPRLAEDELWASVRTRADGALALWKTSLDERGRPAAASYYFGLLASGEEVETYDEPPTSPESAASVRELAIACAQQWPAGGRRRPRGADAWPVVRLAAVNEQRRRSWGNAGVYEGRLDAGLVPFLTNSDAVWSASRLESYRTCSFQFFSQYALRLRTLDDEMETADAATRGTVVHEIMQDAMQALIAGAEALTPNTLGEAIDRLRTNGPGIWDSAPAKYGIGRAALWRLGAQTAFQEMEMLLEREAEASERLGVTSIIGAEEEIRTTLPLDPPLRVVARLDRLDEGDGLVVIVDYKSGRHIPKSHVLDGRRVQLQVYAHAARARAGAEQVVARYAWLNPNHAQWELDSSNSGDEAALEHAVGIAGDVRAGVESGDFRVNPQVTPCPSYCAFMHICRVNGFSRWKQWI